MGNKARRLLTNLVSVLALCGCVSVSTKVPYRGIGPNADASNCNAGFALQEADLTRSVTHDNFEWARCYFQNHRVKVGSKELPFRMTFMEFSNSGDLIQAEQEASITKAIRTDVADGKTPYVVYFVHGWRNNASISSGDAQKFQTVLSYLASFISQRCEATGDDKFCRTTITGVYVGWPGRLIQESGSFGAVLAAPTFPNVRERGDRIGPSVVGNIQKQIADFGEMRQVRTLVLGHSAGANLVMAGLAGGPSIKEGSPLDTLFDGYKADQRMPSPLADMTVLINPASSARRWLDIQERSRNSSGYLSFANNQKPVLVSITSACGRGEEYVKSPDGKSLDVKASDARASIFGKACDQATRIAFTASQVLLSFEWAAEDRLTLGHYTRPFAKKPTQVMGASHGFANNGGNAGVETRLRSLSVARNSQCEIAGNWLTKARERAARGPVGSRDNWDIDPRVSESNQDYIENAGRVRAKASDNTQNAEQKAIYMQSRFRIIRGSIRPAIDSNNPFWNMRADGSAQYSHGAYVSYPLLCHITQLWLDPVD